MCVPVAIVDVVDVVVVGYGNVPAAATVLMGVALMSDVPVGLTLVDVIVMRPVQVAVVSVIHMVIVGDGHVSAVSAVLVDMAFMKNVGCCGHGFYLPWA